MHSHQFIIVGGGICGLFAARTLRSAGITDIKIITKELTDRIQCSENGLVNYATFFVTNGYRHILPFVKKNRRIMLRKVSFIQGDTENRLISWKMCTMLPELIRFSLLCLKFNRHLRAYRKRCKTISEKDALQQDRYLLDLYHTNTFDLLKRLNLEEIAATYMDQTINIIGFDDARYSNAFSFLKWMSTIYMHRMYEFTPQIDKLTSGMVDCIEKDEVVSIQQDPQSNAYILRTKERVYKAKTVILATPPWITRKLIKVKEREPLYPSCKVMHLKGIPSKYLRKMGRYVTFESSQDIISITKAIDGTYLVYTKTKNVSLAPYFTEYEIIYERVWEKAFTFCSYELVPSHYKRNLYIGGDINFSGIEDAAISGISIANQILNSLKQRHEEEKAVSCQ